MKIRGVFTEIPLLLRAVSLYLAAGLLTVFYFTSPILLSSSATHISKSPIVVSVVVIDGEPKSFSMKKFNISLPIKDGLYTKSSNSWTLSDDAVYFALMSERPNNQHGTTFIYGHNNDKVLGRLSETVIGDTVSIITTNGHEFMYSYVRDSIVSPDVTDVLYEKSPTPQLVVMTCDGIWSQARRLMYFDLIEAK